MQTALEKIIESQKLIEEARKEVIHTSWERDANKVACETRLLISNE